MFAGSRLLLPVYYELHYIGAETPPWDSRPVSGAGVVHYHSLHRPRSVPTALGPAPLVTMLYLETLKICSEVKIHFVVFMKSWDGEKIIQPSNENSFSAQCNLPPTSTIKHWTKKSSYSNIIFQTETHFKKSCFL